MNAKDELPARVNGAFLHVALAVQHRAQFFAKAAELWQFFQGTQPGNLSSLSESVRNKFIPEQLRSIRKSRFAAVNPFRHADLFGQGAGTFERETVKALVARSDENSEVYPVPLPFALGNGVFCTLGDLSADGGLANGCALIDFGGFHFTRNAVLSSAYLAHICEYLTLGLSKRGQEFKMRSVVKPDEGSQFSNDVCIWGGQALVFSNVGKNKEALADWLTDACKQQSCADAIRNGIQLKGLGVSFASKHLRFIDPTRHATFDSLLAQATGLGLTPAGYVKFLKLLEVIKAKHGFEDDIATIEMGLFRLIQPYFEAIHINAATKESTLVQPQFISVSPEALAREFEQLGEFSPRTMLYRRKGLPHIYGFQRDPVPASDSPADMRHSLDLVLMLHQASVDAPSTFRPELFHIKQRGLRWDAAFAHLRWRLRQLSPSLSVLPFDER